MYIVAFSVAFNASRQHEYEQKKNHNRNRLMNHGSALNDAESSARVDAAQHHRSLQMQNGSEKMQSAFVTHNENTDMQIDGDEEWY